jgi:biotin carboxylase
MRVLLLTTTTGYQTQSFIKAAERLGIELIFGSDRCHVLEDPWRDGALALRFEKPEEAAQRIVDSAHENPFQGIVAVGDCAPPTAARACLPLGMPYHSVEAADTCRDKYRSRERLQAAGLPVPAFVRFPLDTHPNEIVASGAPPVGFPCVIKPLSLSASRGVIRADTPAEFVRAFERIRALLRSPEVRVTRQCSSDFIQIEKYVEGEEVAVEAVVERGRLQVLALFDKPDPLVGPFFEETIYVTPSRLPQSVQARVEETLAIAVQALGLFHGPLHAEMRINAQGVWMLEVAARPIGGLCAQALRFRAPGSSRDVSLEELIIRLAMGESVRVVRREDEASGVMMIPVTETGVFQEAEGVEAARGVAGVDDVVITASAGQKLVPLPEGSSYPGFIFARGPSPEFVEHALREAHAKLRFVMSPALPVL